MRLALPIAWPSGLKIGLAGVAPEPCIQAVQLVRVQDTPATPMPAADACPQTRPRCPPPLPTTCWSRPSRLPGTV